MQHFVYFRENPNKHFATVGTETPIYRKKQLHVGRQLPQPGRVGEENRKAELKDTLQWHLIKWVVKKWDWGINAQCVTVYICKSTD